MGIRLRARLWLIVVILVVALCIFWSARHEAPQKERHAYTGRPVVQQSASTAEKQSSVKYYYEVCGYSAIFSQGEVDRICSQRSFKKPSVCNVGSIEHLNQKDFRPAKLKLTTGQGSMRIFVHPERDLISNSIVSYGGWDTGGVDLVLGALAGLTGAALVDIGSNLGVFSLRAAHKGHKVVAIDANYQNVIRLRKSALANGLESRLQIFWNALSADSGTVSLNMRLPTDCNIGGGFPTNVLQSHWLRDPVEVRTAGLDDLLVGNNHLNGTSEVIMKMDIEGGEWCAMATAAGAFSHYKIPMVLMEWRGTEVFHPGKASFLLNFFTSRNYTAYSMPNRRTVALSNSDHKNWPGDVLWLNLFGQQRLMKLLHV